MATSATTASNSAPVSSSTSSQSSVSGSNPTLADALFRRKPPKSSSSKSKSKSKSKPSTNANTNPKPQQNNTVPHSDNSSSFNNADSSANVSTSEAIDLIDYLSLQDAEDNTSAPARNLSSTSTHSTPASQSHSNTSGTTPSSSRFSFFTEDMRDRFKKNNRQQARKERKAAAIEAAKAEARLEVEASPRRDAATEERRRLDKKCYELGVYVVEVNPDGHCLYAAIADQLRLLRIQPTATYQDTRSAAASYMRQHPDIFMPFVMMESLVTSTEKNDDTQEGNTETSASVLETQENGSKDQQHANPNSTPQSILPSDTTRRASADGSSIDGYQRLEDDETDTNPSANAPASTSTTDKSNINEQPTPIKVNDTDSSSTTTNNVNNEEPQGEDESLKNYYKYCDNVENSGEWGGEPEILALSKTYNTPIHVLEADRTHKIGEEEELPLPTRSATSSSGGLSSMLKAAKSTKTWISGNKVKPMRISYHRYMYGLGEHYNSLRPRQPVTTTPIVPMLG